jgi:tetratricopeptide (TPR) repeat protein
VKRLILALALGAVALAAILGYASNRREQRYRSLIEQGDTALTRGENLAAVEAFTVAIALKPGSMLGYLKRGEAYRQSGELETALKDLRTASQLDPSATRPLELLGDVEHALERDDRAIARYTQYVRIDDRSPRVLYKLAVANYSAGNTDGAVEALRAALKIDDRLAHAHYLLGLCLQSQRKPDKARTAFHRAIELAPTLFPAREALAELHHRASRGEDRIFQLESLRLLDPTSPARYVSLGLAHADAGQFDRAVVVLSRTAETFPTHTYTYVALGRVWLEVSQARRDPVALQKAIEALERAAGTEQSSEALTLLGKALLLADQPDRAVATLTEAIGRKPTDPLAFAYLADAAERTGNPGAALGALLDYEALEGDPKEPRRRAQFFSRIADLSLRTGNAADAVEWFERAMAADADTVSAGILVRFAEAQSQTGNVAAARASVTRALALEPGNRGARVLLRRLPQNK